MQSSLPPASERDKPATDDWSESILSVAVRHLRILQPQISQERPGDASEYIIHPVQPSVQTAIAAAPLTVFPRPPWKLFRFLFVFCHCVPFDDTSRGGGPPSSRKCRYTIIRQF